MTAARRSPSKLELEAARSKTLPEIVAPGLRALFIGINPGLYSAAVGHHFARPGNRFWPALFDSGFTDRLLTPAEDRCLLQYGCGVTNVVPRATARADELRPDEFRRGAARLKKLAGRYRPGALVFVGLTAYRQAFNRPRAQVGRQEEAIGPSAVWVLPNTSGLNAHYQRNDFAELFAKVRRSLVSDSAGSAGS